MRGLLRSVEMPGLRLQRAGQGQVAGRLAVVVAARDGGKGRQRQAPREPEVWSSRQPTFTLTRVRSVNSESEAVSSSS